MARFPMTRILAAAALVAGALLGPVAASAQSTDGWPSKTVRIVSPFPPGGSVDPLARLFAQHLAERLGQSVVVENKTGGSGSIGTAAVASAPPDGYTWVVVFDTHAVNPSVIPTMPFDTKKDLAPVMLVGTSPMALVAQASQPWSNFAEALAWWGVLAPAGTPKTIVDRMNAELAKILARPDVKEKLSAQGMDIRASSSAEFGEFLFTEIDRWAKVVKDNNIQAGK